MRPNEEYVLSTLVDQFGGRFIDGEDPPDGYIINGNIRIAVEVSMLIEPLHDENGERYPRWRDDAPAKNLAKNIELDIESRIPESKHVFLVIGSPVKQIRKTQVLITSAIVDMIQNGPSRLDRNFLGNEISISIFEGWNAAGSKISSAISNRYSSANIGQNTENLLSERINTKNSKIVLKPNTDEYWLALYNDYWVADEESYRLAYKSLNITHDFDKILIVNGYRQAHVL